MYFVNTLKKKRFKLFYKTNEILSTLIINQKNREKLLFRTLFFLSLYSSLSLAPLCLLFFISLPLDRNKSNISETYIPKRRIFNFITYFSSSHFFYCALTEYYKLSYIQNMIQK